MGLKAVANAILAAGGSQASQMAAAAALGVPYILAKSQLPIVGLSSGSVAAGGGISGITALPAVYPHAFCFFPANILATSGPGSAAGFYPCTFSSTTVGTAFLNQWVPGTAPPTWPASPTAVTNGQGAFTGDTTEQGLIIPVPANAFGPNGVVDFRIRTAYTNSAGTKTLRLRYSGVAGTALVTLAPTTSVANAAEGYFGNDGTTNNQSCAFKSIVGPSTITYTNTVVLDTVDSTAATDIRITEQRNTATDNAVIESFYLALTFGA